MDKHNEIYIKTQGSLHTPEKDRGREQKVENYIQVINQMAMKVTEEQNCVLEVVIGENGILAHLIPGELWDDFMEEDEK